MLEYLEQIRELNDSERALFSSEMKENSKNVLIGQMICFFLGFIGAHRFYLNERFLGFFYFVGVPTLFLIAFINGWQALAEAFYIFYFIGLVFEVLLMRKRVTKYNFRLASEVSEKIKSLRLK